MTKRSKPKMGWHGGGWVTPFAFTQDVLEELTTEIPSIPIAAVENVVAEYILDRESEKTRPKPAERKANLSELEKAVRALQKLLGCNGIDQISRHHILSHVWFAGKPDLLETLHPDLEVLRRAVLKEQTSISKPAGRPVKWPQRQLTDSVRKIFKRCGIKVTTTKDGSFVKAIEIIFAAVGDEKRDAQSLVRAVIKSNKQVEQEEGPD